MLKGTVVINKLSNSSIMSLLKLKKENATENLELYGLTHHTVATWQLILAKKKIVITK